VTPTSIKTYEIPKRAEIDAAARRVYDLLVAKADALYPEALTNLSHMLLKPVADQLGRKRLVIVSEGALQYVPFGALPVPEATDVSNAATRTKLDNRRAAPRLHRHNPPIVNHEIVSLPSTSVLAVLRRELGSRKPAPKSVAVFADPVFDKDDQRVKSYAASRPAGEQNGKGLNAKAALPSDFERSTRESGLIRFDRLVLSRREADQITAMASGQPLKALDFAASRATVTRPELTVPNIAFQTWPSQQSASRIVRIVLSLVDERGQRRWLSAAL
jgi:hypothetical protein